MTIAQNIGFPLRQHTRKSAAEIGEIIFCAAGRSGAARQRAIQEAGGAFRRHEEARRPGRALALEPEVVLYDEPTTGLDPIMSDVINELILGTRRRHPVTSVVVTHDMQSARKVADRVVMLYPFARLAEGEGQILYDGRPADLDRSRDRRVTQFIRGEAGERLKEMQNGD